MGASFGLVCTRKVFWHKDEKRWRCSGFHSALLSGETVENKLTPLWNHVISYHIISLDKKGAMQCTFKYVETQNMMRITSWLHQLFCGCGGQELKAKYCWSFSALGEQVVFKLWGTCFDFRHLSLWCNWQLALASSVTVTLQFGITVA